MSLYDLQIALIIQIKLIAKYKGTSTGILREVSRKSIQRVVDLQLRFVCLFAKLQPRRKKRRAYLSNLIFLA